ncbi:hypothetical protein Y647_01725 [Bacillus subtilis QH-1]|nr:hypothetical protein Y647_01725 [Bacillus subtilis QH-1]
MIDGVKGKKLMKHSDDRGFFAELVRDPPPPLAGSVTRVFAGKEQCV